MPLVKIEYIRSFSSEDKVHVANNLLGNNSSLKWKCASPGEKQATICFQLEKATVISGIDIGNEHSSFIEVLVSRSAGMNDNYKTLLGMTSFMSSIESLQSTNVNRVKMFKKEDFWKPECDEKWDRIKLVCSQLFNTHVKFGLSFVKFYSDSLVEENVLNSEMKLFKNTPKQESLVVSENGSSLEKRMKFKAEEDKKPLTAAAAIRAASSSLLNDPNSHVRSPRLLLNRLKDSASKKIAGDISSEITSKPRHREELFYTEDDEKTNARIDRFIKLKNAEKLKLEEESKKSPKPKNKIADEVKPEKEKKGRTQRDSPGADKTKRESFKRKLQDVPDRSSKKTRTVRVFKSFERLLEDVVIVISGIQNPDRTTLRDKILEMGAKYKGDWDSSCTHLVCAYMNTPKFNQVKGIGKIVTRQWVEECYVQRKKLPWRRHALDKQEKEKDESEDEILEEVTSQLTEVEPNFERTAFKDIREDVSDTEDIIELTQKAIPQFSKKEEGTLTKNKEIVSSESSWKNSSEESTSHCSKDYSVEVKSSPKIEGDDFAYCAEKHNDEVTVVSEQKTPKKPFDFFKNMSFFVDNNFEDYVEEMVKNYIFIHEGSLHADPRENIDYVICGKKEAQNLSSINTRAICILPDWIVDCHKCRQFIPPDEYFIM